MRVFEGDVFYDVISCSNPNILKGMVINHPTMFVPLPILKKYGIFDESYKICSDWEMCVRYYLAELKFKNINKE